jgi:aryl-alcohol dehydrogenase-like predicted oxidoreductase
MKYRLLGKTDLQVSVIGLGTHQFSGEWAKEFTADEVDAMVGRAGELGLNFIDTAECYGDHQVECLLGRSLKAKRRDWILATKFGHCYRSSPIKTEAWGAADVLQQLEGSLRALQTDCIDLYQFHSGRNEDFENEELWTMLNNQVRAGKIRFLGISISGELISKGDLLQLHSAERVNASAVQVVYNRLHAAAQNHILPFCERSGLGVLARVPLAKGFLSGNYRPGASFPVNDTRSSYSPEFNNEQLRLVEEIKRTEVPPGQSMAQWALAWCLRPKVVSSVIVGCKSVEQLESNAAAAEFAEGALR